MNKAIFTSPIALKPLVVGVGNLQFGDDGAGVQVARLLKARALAQVDIWEIDVHSGMSLAIPPKPNGPVFIVNAAISGQRPGYVHCWESRNGHLPEHLLYPGLHGVPQWSKWLDSAVQSGGMGNDLILYAIEGSNFAQGAEISPEVQKAIRTVVQCLIVDIGSRVRRRNAALRTAGQPLAESIPG